MLEMLPELAAAGGSALMGAMATDAWQAARSGITRLFGRQGEEQQRRIEVQLDEDADRVRRAADPDRMRQALSVVWEDRLSTLLGEDPSAADELRELVTRLKSSQPQQVQNITVKDSASGFIVQDGSINYYSAPPPTHPHDGPYGDAPAAPGSGQ